MSPILMALLGTMFTFGGTALGAAMVFFFRGEIKPSLQRVFLGSAAGIMIAAAVWSLLIPAIGALTAVLVASWMGPVRTKPVPLT